MIKPTARRLDRRDQRLWHVVLGSVVAAALTACGTTVPLNTQLQATGTAGGAGSSVDGNAGLDQTGPPVTTQGNDPSGVTTEGTSVAGGTGAATTGPVTSGPATSASSASGAGVAALPTGSAGPQRSVAITGTRASATAKAQPVARSTKSTGATAAGKAPAAGASTAASTIPDTGPGWDRQFVYVGIITVSDAATAVSALGISLSPGNEAGDANAIIAGINKRGGLFGRQVKLVIHDNASANVIADPNSAAQANCTALTQDQTTIADINTAAGLDNETLRGCFAAAHTPLFSVGVTPFDDQTGQQYSPDFYNALVVSYSRLVTPLVARLQAQNYFSGWNSTTGAASPTTKVKVGVAYAGDPASIRAGQALMGAITKAGYAVEGYQYGSETSDGTAAAVHFEGDGVTHVMATDAFLYFLGTSANSQHYFPRLGVSTYNGLQALLETLSSQQLAGAVGVGWNPSLDVDAAQDPGNVGSGEASCLADLAAGGQNFTGQFAKAVGLAICDGLRLPAAGAQSGGGLNPTAVRNGIVSLGTSYPIASSFGSGISATNYGLPGAGRDLSYKTSCSCFAYSGSTYLLS